MEKRKLCSCIAYCIRRVKGSENPIASEYLCKALQSLRAPGEEPSAYTKPIQVCLYEALALGKADDQISSLSHGVPAVRLATHIPFTRHEKATQTHEAVITESELKVASGEIVAKAVADSVAPLQAIVDQLQVSQDRRTARIEAVETLILSQAACSQTSSSNAVTDNHLTQSTQEIDDQPCHTSPCHELAQPALASGNPERLHRAKQKEERRTMRAQHLLARLSRLD
eukprot:Skav236022  [mRNA]  locus=scaffold1524:70552:71232:- [translate_table: standard]